MQQSYIALSIILGSLVIAGAILVKDYKPAVADDQVPSKVTEVATDLDLKNVSRQEGAHIYGNSNAPIRIVEFSDLECPFCARLHPTLKRVVDESEGKVVWEYRHLPLPNHTNAFEKAVATECVDRQLGGDAFWDYTDTLLSNLRSSGQEFYISEATALGADAEVFKACMNDPSMRDIVSADLAAAQAAGGRGTPFSVIVDSQGNAKPVSGALPYDNWIQLLETIN